VTRDLRNYCNRKNIFVAAVFTAAILSAFLVFAYINGGIISTPKITFEDVEISDVSFNETHFNVILIIDNKNFVGGTIKNLSFDIIWDNEGEKTVIAHGEKDTINIYANKKTKTEIPILFYNKNIIPLATGTITQKSLNITVRGNADFEFLFFKINVPFEKTQIIETNLKNIIQGILKFIA